MKTIKTVRTYKYLIISLVNFIILFLARKVLEQIQNSRYPNPVSNYDTDKGWLEYLANLRSSEDLFKNTVYISVAISIFIVLYELEHFKRRINIVIILIWGIYLIISLVELNDHLDIRIAYDDYLLGCFLFVPHLMLIYKYSIVGEKVDFTNQYKRDEEKKYFNIVDDLKSLLKFGHISIEEYNKKKEKALKDKIQKEIISTDEYLLLKKTNSTGLISDDEFSLKVKKMIDKKYIESNQDY